MSAIIKGDFRALKRKFVSCVSMTKKSLLNGFNSSPTFSSFPLFIILPEKKISQLTQIFLWWNFCRFLTFYIIAICSMRDCSSIGCLAFSWNYADRGKKNPISENRGVHSGSFRGKSKFLLNCSKLQLNCQSGNSSEGMGGRWNVHWQ